MADRHLPDWIDGFMLLSENSEPPILFRKWAAISVIASALQRKVRVELGITLTFYPNFYIILVGPSATGKGTAMGFAESLITKVPSIRLAADATSLQALIRRMKETNFTDIDPITGDQHYHSSMTIFSTEFTVFLGYYNRELIMALCDWYDCKDRWTYDTIKRDKEEVIGVWVNMFGGTTPDNIQSSLPPESIGSGLTSRIIFVYEEKRDKLVPIPGMTDDQIYLHELLTRDLEEVCKMCGCFSYTKHYIEKYIEWCYVQDKNPPFHDKKFDGYLGRRRKHLMSIAMVCSASRSNELILEEQDFDRAAQWLAEVEIKMGLTFQGMGKSDIASLLNEAIIFFTHSRTGEIPLWQFAREFEGNMDKIMMERVLETLEAMKKIEVIKKPQADTIIKVLEMKE